MAVIKVTVEKIDGYCNLPMLVGDHFFIKNSKIIIPDGKHICLWALQSMMPIFPVLTSKKTLEKEHWINNLNHMSCPDPKGKVHYRLEIID
ncbi:MAG: TIGR04076 family protein [Asgard group archaeon]|nr:TIGR04076 family protein [Asgard group archaeon]